MNKSAEISKDGRTLTVNTFKDLKHFLDRVRFELPHPTDVGWGFYGLTPVKPR